VEMVTNVSPVTSLPGSLPADSLREAEVSLVFLSFGHLLPCFLYRACARCGLSPPSPGARPWRTRKSRRTCSRGNAMPRVRFQPAVRPAPTAAPDGSALWAAPYWPTSN
jgi:hypothetical protein